LNKIGYEQKQQQQPQQYKFREGVQTFILASQIYFLKYLQERIIYWPLSVKKYEAPNFLPNEKPPAF
jgi:hypothetical protein